jgi:hypothetical protein
MVTNEKKIDKMGRHSINAAQDLVLFDNINVSIKAFSKFTIIILLQYDSQPSQSDIMIFYSHKEKFVKIEDWNELRECRKRLQKEITELKEEKDELLSRWDAN